MSQAQALSVKEAKAAGLVLPYDPARDTGYVVICGGRVEQDSNGHPIVTNESEALARVAALDCD